MDRLFPKSPTRRRFDKNKVYIYAENEEPFPCIRTTDCPLNCLCKNNKCLILKGFKYDFPYKTLSKS